MAADLIRWRAQYNLGLDEIDAQHQSLLELINKAWRAIVRRSDDGLSAEVPAARLWSALLAVVPIGLAANTRRGEFRGTELAAVDMVMTGG